MWQKIKKVLLGILVIVILAIGVGAFKAFAPIDEHFDGDCISVPLSSVSAEDIQVDRERGLAYLSLFNRLGTVTGEPTEPGTIGRMNLNNGNLAILPALLDQPQEFRPHGISLFVDDAGQRYLFVINHPANRGVDEELVELFVETRPGEFSHSETFRSPDVIRPNDLVAVGPRQVYVANDTGQGNPGPANLVYIDGDTSFIVADDIESGGGISRSADSSKIYVAETNAQRIRVLERNPADGSLESSARIDLGSSPDNIDVAADGSLWIGSHSNTLALVMHFITGTAAPTQIQRVVIDADGSATVEEIYLNDGSEISTGSVGVTYGSTLLIGSITARNMLVCSRN
jgi:arylesterase/paraoxonase